MTPTQGKVRPDATGTDTTSEITLNTKDTGTAALYLASLGYHVFPAKVTRDQDGEKIVRPAIQWRDGSTRSEATIRMWWGRTHRDHAICIDCEKSGIVVVDIDMKHGIDGIDSWARLRKGELGQHSLRTTSGGLHELYRADRPVENSQSLIAPGVDVRGAGGMILVHPCAYDDVLLLDSPDQLDPIPACVPSPAPVEFRSVDNPVSTDRVFTDTEARIFMAKYAEGPLREAPAGTINATLNASAVVMSHFVPTFITEDTAAVGLLQWHRDARNRTGTQGTDREALKTIRSGMSATTWKASIREPDVVTELDVTEEPEPTGLLLPDSFWQSRPVLEHIRHVAWQRMVSPDVVLHCVLTRMAALLPHTTRVASSMGQASLNLMVIPVGPSGAGKTQAVSLSAEIVPTVLGSDDFLGALPVGSGEGIAEMYMGTETVTVEGPDGRDRTEKVRQQVRHNALVYVDEGETLARIGQRNGSTTMSALRTAWVGHTLGQANGRQETTRIIEQGTYSLGVIMGFQLASIEPVLADAGTGTAQRMLLSWAQDPSIPETCEYARQPVLDLRHILTWQGHLQVPQEADTALRQARLAVNRGEAGADSELDRHRPLHLMKLSALLALLDLREEITMEDWSLAETMWGTSCHVRALCARHVADEASARAQARDDRAVAVAARSAVAERQAIEKVVSEDVVKLAEHVTAILRRDGSLPASQVRRKVAQRRRQWLDEAVQHAESEGWVTLTEATKGQVGVVMSAVG